MQGQTGQPDWAMYTLELPMVHEPGEHPAYCSGSTNLAGAMLCKATGIWMPEFYRQYFTARNFGFGSAIATVLLVAVIPVMIYNLRQFGERRAF